MSCVECHKKCPENEMKCAEIFIKCTSNILDLKNKIDFKKFKNTNFNFKIKFYLKKHKYWLHRWIID